MEGLQKFKKARCGPRASVHPEQSSVGEHSLIFISVLTVPRVCLSSMRVGGNGYINDYPMGRFLRDAKLYEIGAGTSEVRRLIIGRAFNSMFK